MLQGGWLRLTDIYALPYVSLSELAFLRKSVMEKPLVHLPMSHC